MKVVMPRGREFDPKTLRTYFRELPQDVVAHLAEFCFAGQCVFAPTDRQTCVNIGRHQVWLEINQFLGLTQEQVEAIYAGRGYDLTTDESE